MTEVKTSRGPLRYRIYYRLMDLALAINLLGICAVVVGTASGLEVEDIPPVIYYLPPILIWPITYVVVPLLIVLSSMRDEYAELLWKRTIAQLMIITAVLPPLIYAVIWFISIVIIQGDVANWNGYRPDWLLDPLLAEKWRLGVILEFWQAFTLGFVILFQWNRWRDSR
ncbi:MAG: hypothetical protein HKO08_05610 [Erythrobacter sp.]|nr:hypothetical protein [Erythrobacter sp.]